MRTTRITCSSNLKLLLPIKLERKIHKNIDQDHKKPDLHRLNLFTYENTA